METILGYCAVAMFSDHRRVITPLTALALFCALTTACGGGDSTNPFDSSEAGAGGAGATGGTGTAGTEAGGDAGTHSGGDGGTSSGGTAGTNASGDGGTSSSGSGGAAGTGGSGGSGGVSDNGIVRLIAIGDTGEGNEDQHAVAAQIGAKCTAEGGCDGVLLLGDNFYDVGVRGTDDAQWGPKFEDPYDIPELEGLKFYAVLGNHDYGLTSTGSSEAQVQYTYLPVGTGPGKRRSDKWMMPDTYYDVKFGPVHIFGIDSQDYSDTQRNDMSQRIASSGALWKIVTAHHPRFTSGDHAKDNFLVGNAGTYRILEATYCGSDMLLTGHDHNLEFIDKGRDSNCPNTYFAISGAGAKTRDAGNEFWRADTAGGSQLFYNETIEGFAYMEFNGPKLHFQFIDKNGALLWEKTLSK